MAADERDAMFEKALARQLRGGGASGDLRGATANCAEAEILGAYHERSLTAAEMAECARHISECARCQEILSQLEATDEVSMETVADEGPQRASDLGAQPIAMPAPKHSRRAIRYWIAPLGAIAAGLLVWVAVNHQKEERLHQKATAEVALSREYAPMQEPTQERKTPAAAARTDEIGNVAPEAGARTRDDLLAQKKESTERDEKSSPKDLPAMNNRVVAPRVMTSLPPLPKPEAKAGVGYGTGGGIGAGSGDGIAPGSAGAKIVPPAGMTESVEVTAEAPAINSVTNAAPKPTAPPRVPSMTQTVTVEGAAPPVAQNQTVEITADTNSMQSLPIAGRNVSELVLLTPGVAQISAPGGNNLWRVGRVGRIETSKDSGAHWKKQKSHVKVDLSGGFSPSVEICWIIGSAGTILRSVDGGAHWKKVASPIAGEIAGINAVDALHATVWDANRNSMFVTADGGISWSAVAHN